MTGENASFDQVTHAIAFFLQPFRSERHRRGAERRWRFFSKRFRSQSTTIKRRKHDEHHLETILTEVGNSTHRSVPGRRRDSEVCPSQRGCDRGTLSTHLVACPTLCTSGTLSGDLSGSFDYTMATMTATSDPNTFILVGSFVVTNATGTLFGTDTTLWDISSGQFTDMESSGAAPAATIKPTGKITIVGLFDIVAGTGQSIHRPS
jgi:hypothetical protein